MSRNRSIVVKGTVVTIATRNEHDYISLSDMVRDFEGQGALIENWLRAKDTVLFLGVWEQLNNPGFNSLEFEGIRNEAGRNSFFLSIKKWSEKTGAIGLFASAGRYGGTYAHRDIAFEFGSWLSPEFKLYLIKEFQRLKDDEAARSSREWSFQRTLAKVNCRIHTDAIQEHRIPPTLTKPQITYVYASEADLLNVALFGKTASDWRGNDEYISLTDMLRAEEGEFFIADWLRNRNTMEFLGVWEHVHNPNFNYGEFTTIRNQAGLNSFLRGTDPDLDVTVFWRDWSGDNARTVLRSTADHSDAVYSKTQQGGRW